MSGDVALIAWIAWAVAWALGLRLVIAWTIRRHLHLNNNKAAILAYAAIVLIFLVSIPLHGAMLGPAAMYGATPREAFSFIAYLVAPFGLPLLIGGLLVMITEMRLDLLSCCASFLQKRTRP